MPLIQWAHVENHYFKLTWGVSGLKREGIYDISSVQFNSVAQSCPTLCDPMNRSMPGLPVQHQLPQSTQTHVHRVGDAIQPSHPLSSPSPPAPNPSQHQGLFQWVNSSHEVAKVSRLCTCAIPGIYFLTLTKDLVMLLMISADYHSHVPVCPSWTSATSQSQCPSFWKISCLKRKQS